MTRLLSLLACVAMALASATNTTTMPRNTKPNIVWFLTDDQDQLLGGSFPSALGTTPMPKTTKLMAEQGATATNFFIHTPICCPSRSELLTGRYFHNIKAVGRKDTCMHTNSTLVNSATFAPALKQAGYTVEKRKKELHREIESRLEIFSSSSAFRPI